MAEFDELFDMICEAVDNNNNNNDDNNNASNNDNGSFAANTVNIRKQFEQSRKSNDSDGMLKALKDFDILMGKLDNQIGSLGNDPDGTELNKKMGNVSYVYGMAYTMAKSVSKVKDTSSKGGSLIDGVAKKFKAPKMSDDVLNYFNNAKKDMKSARNCDNPGNNAIMIGGALGGAAGVVGASIGASKADKKYGGKNRLNKQKYLRSALKNIRNGLNASKRFITGSSNNSNNDGDNNNTNNNTNNTNNNTNNDEEN